MSVDDYITPKVSEVDGEKKSPRVLDAEVQDANELTRKRDILVSAAILGELKSYIGEKLSAVQIRKMNKEKLEAYFLLYQEKLGQETTNEMMSSLVEMSVKGLSYFVDIDNQEELKNDLINNKQLRRTLGKQVGGITEKYGDVVAFVKLFFTVGKHVSFSSADASTNSDSAEELKTTPSTNSDSAEELKTTPSTNSDSASTMLAQK